MAHIRRNPKKSVLILLIIVGIGYWTYSHFSASTTQTSYVLGRVTRGTLITTVTGTGQVAAVDQIDIKPKTSGELVWIGVKEGDTVRAGQALMSIDATDAKQAVVNAEQSLIQAKLQYEKDSAAAPIDFQKAQESLADASTTLATDYGSAFNAISSAYITLPSAMTGADTILHDFTLSPTKSQWNIDVIKNIFSEDNVNRPTVLVFADKAVADYKIAREQYDRSISAYKSLTRYSSGADIDAFLEQTIDATTALAQALQSDLNLLDTVIDIAQKRSITLQSGITTLQTNGRTYLSSVNSSLTSLLSQQQTITNDKRNILNYERSLSLLRVGNESGANPLSLQVSKNNIRTQELSLQDLKEALANYTITAPFAGTVALVPVQKSDSVSTGTTVATLITHQNIAELSLNELDAAKIRVGQKAELTFDAIEDLTIPGTVSSIDTVGTVSQGVVSYTLKISLDQQDARIKPGMTTSATITTGSKENVLLVPNTAIKNQGKTKYVELVDSSILPIMGSTTGQRFNRTGFASSTSPTASSTRMNFRNNANGTRTNGTNRMASGTVNTADSQGIVLPTSPIQKTIEVGLANDTVSEVLSGLVEGDRVVTRTITSTQTTTATPSLFSAVGGGNRSATGGVRIPRD